jgi:hypothetical protein
MALATRAWVGHTPWQLGLVRDSYDSKRLRATNKLVA